MERAEYDGNRNFVRKLQDGDRPGRGNHARLTPCEAVGKIKAIQYAFCRFDAVHLSAQKLALELQAKGFPPPRCGWTSQCVARLLRTCAYAGMIRFFASARGKYHKTIGGEIVSHARKPPKPEWKRSDEDAICVEGAHEAIVAPELFRRVNRKFSSSPLRGRVVDDRFPLSGLMTCAHCHRAMTRQQSHVRDRKTGRIAYSYPTYRCTTYRVFGGNPLHNPTNCRGYGVRADLLLTLLVESLREMILGPGREALLETVAAKLKGRKKAAPANAERLQNGVEELNRRIKGLIALAETQRGDLPELADRLEELKRERERARGEFQDAQSLAQPDAPWRGASDILDQVEALCGQLTSKDPAIQREALRQFVDRIECHADLL
jgi:hypothetical protein